MAETETTCRHCQGTGKEPANILKTLRGDREQQEIAAKLGITQSAYSRLEKGAGAPGGLMWNKHLRHLAELYHVTTDQLLGRAPLSAAKKDRPPRPADRASVAKSAASRKAAARKNQRRR
jgi:transcriptional regulator with XRE-family HTH domain